MRVWPAWAALAVLSCGPSSAIAPDFIQPKTAKDAFGGGVECSSYRPPTEPDLMGWDAGSRLQLDTAKDEGLVAVRYRAEGCDVQLELLNCKAKGKYDFKPYHANESKTMKSQRDLFAELPIGAAKLGGKVGGGRALRTDYMLVGLLHIPLTTSVSASDLLGDPAACKRATHVVSRIYVGGFAMASGESERLSAQASIFGVGAGGEQGRSTKAEQEEGSAAACEKAEKDNKLAEDCSVPLRLGLMPIAGREEAATVDPPPPPSRPRGDDAAPAPPPPRPAPASEGW